MSDAHLVLLPYFQHNRETSIRGIVFGCKLFGSLMYGKLPQPEGVNPSVTESTEAACYEARTAPFRSRLDNTCTLMTVPECSKIGAPNVDFGTLKLLDLESAALESIEYLVLRGYLVVQIPEGLGAEVVPQSRPWYASRSIDPCRP